MLITQVVIMFGMFANAFLDVKTQIDFILYAGLAVAIFSATQDIVLDAYRRELLPDEELGLGNSYYANAYRLSAFIPGSLGLILSDSIAWKYVFIIIGLFMFIGIIYSFVVSDTDTDVVPPKNLVEAVVDPFKEFFLRDGFKSGFFILFFILFYKFGDTVATSLITPFYIDVGFSNSIIGTVTKVVGFWSMVIGGFVGGAIMFKTGINKALWIFGVVQMVSILGFAALNEVGANITLLGVVVAFEY
jgi:PAT family beta-lactamase induction signal transducer AmpG